MRTLTIFLSILFIGIINAQEPIQSYSWRTIDAKGSASPRHENAFVEYKYLFYLIGGRGIQNVDVYNPETNSWQNNQPTPFEVHHFQAVVYGDVIYLLGAMTGQYPKEQALENIWKYYPESDTWEKGAAIPKEMQRGGAGVVLHQHKLYIAGGIELGHTSGCTNRLDCYDLKTGEWTALTKAPHVRDHFFAALVGDKIYCIGGRNTSVHHKDNFNAFFESTVSQVDVYDIESGVWMTLIEPLPVPTAAGGVAVIGKNIIYMGGEASQELAYNETQCLNTETEKWEALNVLNIGRHGTSAIVYKNKIWIAAGSPVRGGGNISSIEVFEPKE